MKRILFVLAMILVGLAWAGGVTLANLEDRPNDELAGVDFAAPANPLPYEDTRAEAALPVPVPHIGKIFGRVVDLAPLDAAVKDFPPKRVPVRFTGCGPNGCSSAAAAGSGGPVRRMFARRGPLRRMGGWVNSHRPRLLGRLFGRGRGGC